MRSRSRDDASEASNRSIPKIALISLGKLMEIGAPILHWIVAFLNGVKGLNDQPCLTAAMDVVDFTRSWH